MPIDFLAEALESAAGAMCQHPRDWSLDHRDAWLWGLVVGWGDAIHEVAAKHGWTPGEVQRLLQLRVALWKASGAQPEDDG